MTVESNSSAQHRPPVVLLILDGWGIAPLTRGNAIHLAKTPRMNALTFTYPTFALSASGEAVGLPWGEMGNSEVGHMNIGAGHIVYQDLPRITKAIADGSFATNEALQKAFAHAKERKSTLHIAGLVSDGGVHSSNEHLYALLEAAKAAQCERVAVHVFLDGRDTPYNRGSTYVADLVQQMQRTGIGVLATLSGRFFAMDRDRHWERTERTYRAMTEGKADATASDAAAAIAASYARGVYDEEFVPTVLESAGKPVATVAEGDALVFFNFRNDRMRQIAEAFVVDAFTGFARTKVADLLVVTMTEYETKLPVTVAFPHEYIATPLAKVVSDAGYRQLHIAETEKYAHVTFFLNGGREEPFPNERRVLVPSPRVTTYSTRPAMGSLEITDALEEHIRAGTEDFFVANYANADMVGHTGDLQATIAAVETIDGCIGRVVDATLAKGGCVVITADHGNAEEVMKLTTGVIDKEHSTNPVPLIIVKQELSGTTRPTQELSQLPTSGFLADVAPTVLALLGIPKPPVMTGRDVLARQMMRSSVY